MIKRLGEENVLNFQVNNVTMHKNNNGPKVRFILFITDFFFFGFGVNYDLFLTGLKKSLLVHDNVDQRWDNVPHLFAAILRIFSLISSQ